MKFRPVAKPYGGVIDKYWDWMPAEMKWVSKEKIVSLGEGATRLWHAKKLEQFLADKYAGFRANIYLKVEADNRGTRSSADRGMSSAVTMALHNGEKNSTGASSRYISRSAKAYCNLAGIELIDSSSEYFLHGRKTEVFEIVDDLNHAPRFHIMSAEEPGSIAACWQGYKEYYAAGRICNFPKIIGYRAESSLSCNPQDADTAIAESFGKFDSVSEAENFEAHKLVTELENMPCGLDSAITVAGLIKEVKIAHGLAASSSPYLKYTMFIWYDCDIVCTVEGDGRNAK